MHCKLCDGELVQWLEMPLDAKKNEATPFSSVFKCQSCLTGTTQPTPTIDQVKAFYDLKHYYTQGDSHIQDVALDLWNKIFIKLAWSVDYSKLLEPAEFAKFLPAGGTVCDLGCGDGWNLQRFKQHGFSVVGVDPDPKAIAKAAAGDIEVLQGTSEALPESLGNRQFDLVTMTHSLEHTIDPLVALQNAAQLTKAGGYFYCEVPNCQSIHFEMLTVCSANLDLPRHLWHFSPDGLRKIIEEAGFQFEGWRFSGFSRHHLPSWRKWEMTIYERLAQSRAMKHGMNHTFANSCWMFARSAFAEPKRKYDSVGVLAKKRSS